MKLTLSGAFPFKFRADDFTDDIDIFYYLDNGIPEMNESD